MRIRKIRLSNLNSLRGEHAIDLMAEPFASAGLFAITGPMGAGKSTLLDAVTLALYGKAARYGNESNPEHVMSRHCGECSAEVEFQVPAGIYRAVWQSHRARKKPDGALQPPKRYIYDAAGAPLTQHLREAEVKIEELLGLNYERFLRSALLAQGEFARFLKANANERAELLESLTGTEIYSRLGGLAFAEANRREAALQAKESGLGQLALLDDAKRAELREAVAEIGQKRERLTREQAAGAEMLRKIASLEEARDRERRAVAAEERIEQERRAAATDLERLRRHRLTLPFAEDLARLNEAETALSGVAKRRATAAANHAAAATARREASAIFRAAVDAALMTERHALRLATEALEQAGKAAQETRAWLDQHAADAKLADHLPEAIVALGEWKAGRVALAQRWSEWRTAAAAILPEEAAALPVDLAGAEANICDAQLAAFVAKAEARGTTLEADRRAAERQAELRQDHFAKARLVARLEGHRHELKSGAPCPLCGALEHPFAEGSAPSPELAELEAESRRAKEAFDCAAQAARLAGEQGAVLARQRPPLLEGMQDCAERLASLQARLAPLGAAAPSSGEEGAFRQTLQARDQAWRTQQQKEREALERQAQARRAVQAATEAAEILAAKQARLEPAAEPTERRPGRKLPTVPTAEEADAAARQREQTTATQAQDRRLDEQAATAQLAARRAPLEETVAGSEFQVLSTLRAARLPAPTAQPLDEMDQRFRERTTAAAALRQQVKQDLARMLEDAVLEGEPAIAFRARHMALKAEADRLLAEQTTGKNQLETDDANRRLREERQKELEVDRANLVVWRHLRELIGSHDGSKFRRYAQTITLDLLTRHANRHLVKLSDRYRVRRDGSDALNLQIEDRHQSDARRPMASLSGGESFLVSLALALGLSDLAGRKVRIDSLFIDEGFGSLDPESLEVAIAALEALRQDHKTVGIISHVGLLMERISTQIVVERLPGGVSRLRIAP